VAFWLTLISIEPEKEKHKVEIVSKSNMRAIYVGLGVFGILAAIGLGISALVIGKSSILFSDMINILALDNKNVDSTSAEGKVSVVILLKAHFINIY
jgi:hypothetical protein